MQLPRLASRGARAVIDRETVDNFIGALPPYLQDILRVLWATGTRPSNLCRARVPNLDEENGCLVFAPHNALPDHPIHKTYKRTGEPLFVPLSDAALAICKRLNEKCLAEGDPNGYLFKSKSGGPIHPKRLSQLTCDHAKRRGLKGKMFNYAARHTRATEMLEDGFTDMEVAKNLGLRDGRMVYRHYGHLGANAAKLRENLNRHINGRHSPGSETPTPQTPSSDEPDRRMHDDRGSGQEPASPQA
jgi:integrase